MKIKYDKILGQIREKDGSTPGTGTPPAGFNSWQEYYNSLIVNNSGQNNLTRLISGTVTWVQNLEFQISPLVYEILGQHTESPEKLVTIPANVSANPMFAIIYADVFGNVAFILGTPAADPAVPIVNPATQLLITPIYILGLGTTPTPDPDGETGDIITTVIYNENIEWTTAKTEETGVTIDFNAIADPAVGTKHIKVDFAGTPGITWHPGEISTAAVIAQKDISVAEETNSFSWLLSELFSTHKTDTLSGTSRILSWFNFIRSSQLNVILSNIDTLGVYRLKVVNVLTPETWAVADLNFSVNLPQNLQAITISGTVPIGDYRLSVEGFSKYLQIYTPAAAVTFTPAASKISFTRAAGAIQAADGNLILSLKSSVNWFTNTALLFELYNGTAKVGELVFASRSLYGFNPDLAEYQTLTIPIAHFNPTDTKITKLLIAPVNTWPNNSAILIDNIFLQTGVNPQIINNTLHNSLNGLQGGDLIKNEFYHLTKNELDYIKPAGIFPNIKLGFLYARRTVLDAQKISSSDEWDVPSVSQWGDLFTTAGGSSAACGNLKEAGDLYWLTPNQVTINSFGFNARGGGMRSGFDGSFGFLKQSGYFLAKDNYVSSQMIYVFGFNEVTIYYTNPAPTSNYGGSVRLVYTGAGTPASYTGNDGKIYRVIKIGDQYWTAENLAETKFRNGSNIPGPIFTNSEWAALTTPAYCMYEDDPDNATSGTSINISTDLSVSGNGTQTNPIILLNDQDIPSALKYYGTDINGVKGWHLLPVTDNVYIVYNEAELLAAYNAAISYAGKAATIYIGATITLTNNRAFIRAITDSQITFYGVGQFQIIAIGMYTFTVNSITFRNIAFTANAMTYVTVQGHYASFYNCRFWSEQYYNGTFGLMKIAVKCTGAIINNTGLIYMENVYHASSDLSAINDGDIQPLIIQNTVTWSTAQRLYINITKFDSLRNFDTVSRVLLHSTNNVVYKVTGDLTWYYHPDQVWPGAGYILSQSILLKKGSIEDLRADYVISDLPVSKLGINSAGKVCKVIDELCQTIAYSATPTHNFATSRNAEITLTANVTTYTLQNVPQGAQGTIEIIQNATGGFGINDFAHTGLTVQYLAGQKATAANINSTANGTTILNYYRSKTSNILYVSFGAFNTAL